MNLRTQTVFLYKRQWAAASLLAAAMTLTLLQPAMAQTPPEPNKPLPTEKQSLVNPYPKDKGNAQNRGRASADLYWGVAQGNVSYQRPAYARINSQNLLRSNAGMLEVDGWGYPRGAWQQGVFRLAPRIAVPATAAGVPSSFNFQFVNGPSTLFFPDAAPDIPQAIVATGYFRAPAVPRPNLSAFEYSANPNTNRFVWNLNTLNVANTIVGQQVRFQVRVHIPEPAVADPNVPGSVENRISDARYVVYYYLRVNDTTYLPKRKVFTLSQISGGEQTLINDNGQPAFFPFLTTATNINSLPPHPELGVPFQGVTLDDTTTDQGSNLFVLASGLNLVRSVDMITGTPTVTSPHGGRRPADADPTLPGNQNWPDGVQPIQPRPGPQKQDPAIPAPDANIVNPVPITALDFINIPGDPRYDPSSPQYNPSLPFEAYNVSTLFRGPESLLEPRRLDPTTPLPPPYPIPDTDPLPGLRVAPGTPNRARVNMLDPFTQQPIVDPNNGNAPVRRTATAVDANNHNIFRFNPRAAYDRTNNPAVPFFSHVQVIYPRTEFAIDPEIGVSDEDKDGTLTIAVGAVYCLDWLTGAPIWRFPDRTYVPGNSRNPYLRTDGTTTFNANDSSIVRDPVTGERVGLVPGIATVDKNLDGVIEDEEVFIVGTGFNSSGGVFASVTYVPRVLVRGNVQIPQYRVNPTTNETELKYDFANPDHTAPLTLPAPAGRYYTSPNPLNPNAGFRPVEVGMAFIAAANGVIYAVDAYGNNDNDYFPNRPVGSDPSDYRIFGRYRPGTTNVLWSFSRAPIVRGRTDVVQRETGADIPTTSETLGDFYQRLKRKIPATGSFSGAPVVAYRRDEQEFASGSPAFNSISDELRLFAGNENGVLYAMDARADAGIQGSTASITGVQALPFRKETYRPRVGVLPNGQPNLGAGGLKWWFHTRGSIVATPAVSLMRQNAGSDTSPAQPIVRKGVYVTSTEGRVYCVDWEGPVTKGNHNNARIWNGRQSLAGPESAYPPPTANDGASVVAAHAEDLNDNYLFHNVFPANDTARPDQLEGTTRPRWTFPNLYRDIDNVETDFSDPADFARNNTLAERQVTGVNNTRLAEPETTLGPITTSPVLIDFPWTDPLISGAPTRHITYVAIQADDVTQNGLPATQSRVYLLDQVGDRANFLTNTRIRGSGNNARVFAHPRDRFSPRVLLGESAPAWTFRFVFDWYSGNDSDTRVMNRRNSPSLPSAIGTEPVPALSSAALNGRENAGLPGRKIVPTLFVGGVGRLYALDFDPETALFMRWRRTLADTREQVALPDYEPLNNGDLFPGPEAAQDLLNPIDRILDPATANNPVERTNLRDRRLLVRTVPLSGNAVGVTNIVISGGPLQNRSTLIEYLPPTGSGSGLPALPTVPPKPTNDAPNLRPLFIDPTATTDLASDAVRFDESGMRVNQDINDPVTTTEGYFGALVNPNYPEPTPDPRIPNTAYQYPMLFITDEVGDLQLVSSNIEGEDYDTNFSTLNESTTIGWGIFEVTDERYSQDHVLHLTMGGAGGPAGVAVLTNAYFPALSPSFANATRAISSPADPFRFYQFGEPNTTTPTPYKDPIFPDNPPTIPAANNDDPRPDFRPRSFSSGTPATPGPDGITGTPDDVLATAGDRHTGQTGFPLDLNGLFFDKRLAGIREVGIPQPPDSINNGLYDPSDPTNQAPNAFDPGVNEGDANYNIDPLRVIPGQHPNATFEVKLRLPGYSYIGGNANQADENNQIPDGPRTNAVSGTTDSDDINASGQNITWIYAGGLDGVLKAYTPAAQGQASGFVAGQPGGPQPRDGVNGAEQVAIVDRATYEAVVADAADGRLSDDTPRRIVEAALARNGGQNFYEYGESVYILVFDLLAQTRQPGEPIYVPTEDTYIPGTSRDIQITANSISGNGRVFDTRVGLLPGGGGVTRPAFYYQQAGNPLWELNPNAPHFGGTNPTPYGVAAYTLRLDNPSQNKPLVPGDRIQIGVQVQYGGGANSTNVALNSRATIGGGNSQEQVLRGNADTFFSIANPLAVQAFLRETVPAAGGTLRPVGAEKASAADTQNGIGPFAASSLISSGPKVQIADGGTALTTGTTDPDKDLYDYSQALTNGNVVQRRDLRRFIGTGFAARVNDRYGALLQEGTTGNRTNEPAFFFPVIASAGYINHGESGSTDTGTGQQNLRVLNRSLSAALSDVRVLPVDETVLWRSWPGTVPNADANTFNDLGQLVDDRGNPRLTPAGMDPYGRINRLPWERNFNENKPWNPTALPNNSPDYPNIPSRANQAIRVSGGAAGNLTEGTGPLPAALNQSGNLIENISVSGKQRPDNLAGGRFATAARISVPKHQPANLVALHNLTSTYQPASTTDDPNILTGATEGPIQLPRGNGIARRNLFVLNQDGTSTGNRAVTPFGYTVQMAAMVDYDRTGQLTPPAARARNSGVDPQNPGAIGGRVLKAYREFEIAYGVPIDMSMKVVESEVDLGKVPHTFGLQNGLLGYGSGPAAFQPGFLPTPLRNTALFGSAPYDQYFKKFTVQNIGNVNLWNLRASQRFEINDGTANYIPGSGNTFSYFALRSSTVDPRFGILAVGADPSVSLLGQNNLMPMVVTSLDRQFDAAWDAYLTTQPPFSQPINSLQQGALPSPYAQYYQQLAGRHTLHKPRVGIASSATLGVPDVPASQVLRNPDDTTGLPQPAGVETVVGVTVPVGTPVGEYSSLLTGTPLVVFEDHDTNQTFNPTPFWNNNGIAPAGPFYNGSQLVHPGANPILTAGGGNGEGVWRARRFLVVNGQNVPELQPATDPGISLKLTVTEAPLTGDVPDRAVPGANIDPAIASGRLPGVDLFPLIDRTGGGILRAAAALSPAAYRSPNGNLHLFFSRNYGGDLNAPFANPGQPFRLYHSHLFWNVGLGTFQANAFGAPLTNSVTALTAASNTGAWFSPPVMVRNPSDPNIAVNESNVSPFVLQTQTGGATLFWINSVPGAAGQPLHRIMFSPLDANGIPTAASGQELFLNPDASVLRFSPRAVYEPISQNTLVFYYGGSSGRWGLYYVTRPADGNGTPTGAPDATGVGGIAGAIEIPLQLPGAIASATDPAPVLRDLQVPTSTGFRTARVVDVYYTGISRTTQTPDVYMSRFEVTSGNRGVRLRSMELPPVRRERLTSTGREAIYQARHIGWFRTVNPQSLGLLPTIYLGANATTAQPIAAPVDGGENSQWQVDEATGMLYQTFNRVVNGQPTENIVYVDAAAGTVRFRGRGAPRSNEYVFADYLPQTYRLTVGGVSNLAPFGFIDYRALPATTALQGRNVVVRRAQQLNSVGRHWLFWQKGAEGGRPASLFYSVRRIGIDLKAPDTQGEPLGQNDTIHLSARNANGNQTPLVSSVAVAGVNVPFEVDYVTGRIYVEPQYEGLEVQVTYIPTSRGLNGQPAVATGVLSYVDELAPTGQGTTGIQVPLNRSVNEGVPYAFLDTLNVNPGVTRTNPLPASDPTLTPGRVWLFWTSPRGRVGSQLFQSGTSLIDAFPGGFDIYWQTLAPVLDPLTSTFPQ